MKASDVVKELHQTLKDKKELFEDNNYKIKEIDWDNGFNVIDIKGQ